MVRRYSNFLQLSHIWCKLSTAWELQTYTKKLWECVAQRNFETRGLCITCLHPSSELETQCGYLVGGYEFVLQVRIRTPYAGGFGMAILNQ
jgi:hypothetical protein